MNTKRRVLFLITKATWGGAQKYVFDLSTHLLPALEPIVAYGEEGRLADLLKNKNIQIIHLKSLARDVSLSSDIQSFSEIRKCIREVQPDVVHLNSSKAAGLGALAA